MKRLLALALASLALSSCGGNRDDDSSDLLDGILNGQNGDEEVEEANYETPVSEGPTMLPPEEEDTVTDVDNE